MKYHSHFRIFKSILIGFFCANTLIACSTLPQHSNLYPSTRPTHSDNSSTFSRLNLPLQQHPHLTGYHLLANPAEALASRLALIEQAQYSLDIQYYIWHNDKIGQLFFYKLIQAANRGVHIRLLIDDNNAKELESSLLALVQHPNIEIKLFNPYRFREVRQWDWLFDVKRINRRMHNKAVIADQKLSIIGGRNIGNEYFNVSDEFQFADIDILLAGQANQQIATSFEQYWFDNYALEVRDVINARRHTLRYPQLVQKLNEFYQQHQAQFNQIEQDTKQMSQWLQQDLSLTWVQAKALIDPVAKIRNQAKQQDYVYPQLLQHIKTPQQQLDIISAYFVPRKQGTQQLRELQQSGVNVRILTNSFASNDVPYVHAFYAPYRKDLLNSGVSIYEFLPNTNIEQFMNNHQEITQKPVSKAKLTRGGSSHASLHAKTYILDQQQVFIGSMNLDPRSIIYNTELGVLLDSPTLAQQLHQEMDQHLGFYAWHLQLNPQQDITWYIPATDEHPELLLNHEPNMQWWQKSGLKIVSWLPIESLF